MPLMGRMKMQKSISTRARFTTKAVAVVRRARHRGSAMMVSRLPELGKLVFIREWNVQAWHDKCNFNKESSYSRFYLLN